MSDAVLQTSRDGAVAILTLNRPERRNALNIELCDAMAAASAEAVADGARAIVVTGEGSSFCSGADLTQVYGQAFISSLYTMLHGLARLPVPLIAAVNGPAIGAGTQLAIACDLRMADDAAKFAIPTVRNGLAVDAWTIRTLGDITGHGVARRMMLAADTLDRSSARAANLVDRDGGVDDAIAWAHELAAYAPLALAHNKLVLNGWADDAALQRSFDAVWASEDVQESALARTQKRDPRFSGR